MEIAALHIVANEPPVGMDGMAGGTSMSMKGRGNIGTTSNFGSEWRGMSQTELSQMTAGLNLHYLRGRIIQQLQLVQDHVEAIYANSTTPLNTLVKQDLAAAGTSNTKTPQSLAGNKTIIENLISSRKQNLEATIRIANTFSGGDPLVLSKSQRSDIGIKSMGLVIREFPVRTNEILNSYESSYRAAKNAKIIAQLIDQLEAKSTALSLLLNTSTITATGAAQLSAMAGSVALSPGSTLTLDAVLKAAVALFESLKHAATLETTASVASRWIPFATLFWPSNLGNSDLYPPDRAKTTLTLPASIIVNHPTKNLAAKWLKVALAKGTVKVPYRIYGDSTKYSVIATQASGGVSPKVPVRLLTLDRALNAYTFTTTSTPPRILVFPIASPGNSSSTTPITPIDVPVYTGLTLTPIEVKAQALPAVDQLDLQDCIYCFPVDSGLQPIYAVFSSPYDGATTKGQHSGRMYNPDKAGGPTQNLDWKKASVTKPGINLVKLHTGRFAPSDANKIMIERLGKILKGEIAITDVDKRFYTHELRELERYRSLGVADGIEGNVWNNAHSATLEDFKLKDSSDLFYTPDAIIAENKQVYGE